jgi:uncharacterized HhH-GPD family protein
MPTTMKRPKLLAFTPDEEAQKLCAQDSIAFVIGFILDQQIRIQHAFHSPLELKRRLDHLDPHRIADMDEQELIDVFAQKPVLHRFPGNMGKRTHACMQYLVDEYDGDADQVWLGATDLADLRTRIAAMPGFGEFKAKTVSAVLCRHFGLGFTGWEDGLPPYGALAYVDTLEDLTDYQKRKGEYKKQLKAAKGDD